MWKNSKDELPQETYSYGCESELVLIAVKPYYNWEYGIGYCVRHDNGVTWVGNCGEIDHNLDLYWQYIKSPTD